MDNLFSYNKSRLDTLSASLIGFALTYVFNSYEQNALGNWFVLLGQVLETNATFIQLYNSKVNNDYNEGIDLDKLILAIEVIEMELNKLKEENKNK